MTASSRRIALTIAAAFFMQMLDGVIIVTALPAMAAAFGVEPVAMSVGLTAYMLTAAAFIPLAGWLADRLGEKTILLAAIAIFTIASLACALAPSLPAFVFARAVQGFGGALLVPVGRMIVLAHAPKSEMVRAVALITWPALIAPVIGPALGGLITTTLSWHWIFLINLPLGALGLILVAILVPASTERHGRPMDWLGLILSATGMGALLVGLELFVHAGDRPLLALTLIAIGAISGLLAIAHMRRTAIPLLDLTVFRHQTFRLSNLLAGTYFRLAINAVPFLLPLLFQLGFGLDPLASGGMLMAYFLGNLAMKAVTTPMLRHFGFRGVLVGNGLLGALSIAAMALLVPTTPAPLLLGILFFAGLTRSMQFTALTTIAFAEIEPNERGAASTLSTMLQQGSALLGIAAAAGLLNLFTALRGETGVSHESFVLTFLAFAALAAFASLVMLRLAPDAGAEVSGHARPAAPRSGV